MQIDWLESAFVDLHRVRRAHPRIQPCRRPENRGVHRSRGQEPRPLPGRWVLPGEVPGTRELVIPRLPYFVVYRLTSDAVQILRVLHDKQKWPSSS